MSSYLNRIFASVTALAIAVTAGPLFAAAPASAVVASAPAGSVGDSTTVEFAAGTRDANALLTTTEDGELTLSPPPNSFSAGSIPSGWITHPWTQGAGVKVANGALVIEGSDVASTSTFSPGAVLEFDATFRTDQQLQHAGFAQDGFNTLANAMFSTNEGGLNISAGGTYVAISPSYLDAQHHYKIAWGLTAFTFSIDNVVVGTLPWESTLR